MIHSKLPRQARTTRIGRLAAVLAVAGFVLHLVVMPVHVLCEDHCRVVGGLEAGLPDAHDPARSCDHCGHEDPGAAGSPRMSARKPDPGHGFDRAHPEAPAATSAGHADTDHPHCPVPVQAHLDRMKGDPARLPTRAGSLLAPRLVANPVVEILPDPPAVSGRACRDLDRRPPRQLPFFRHESRGPPPA